MSEQSPYQKLGVTETASFEEIQDAKKRLCLQFSGDTKIVESIETAYDAIIMDRLKMRQEGKIKVPERIRFPERLEVPKPNPAPVSNSRTSSWLRGAIDTPSKADLIWPTGVFFVLAGVSLVLKEPQVVSSGNMVQSSSSLVPLLMALGFFSNIYFLNRKEGRFGRSFLITAIALILGISLGFGIVNIFFDNNGGNLVGDEQFAAAIALFFFWLSSCFLR